MIHRNYRCIGQIVTVSEERWCGKWFNNFVNRAAIITVCSPTFLWKSRKTF